MDFDPGQEEPAHDESARSVLESEAVNQLSTMDDHGQEPRAATYRDDPNFRDILHRFQNGELEECLERLNQFLVIYPEDGYLLTFKQDVEIRLKLQKNSQQQRIETNRGYYRKVGVRTLTIAALISAVLIFFAWGGNKITQVRLAQRAALTAQSLDAKCQTADSFLGAGRPEEALRLYKEIQQMAPSYKGIDQKIQEAEQTVAIETMYQEGVQAIKDGKTDRALEILSKVDELHPRYKDTLQLIQKIEQEQEIASLVKKFQSAYFRQDWTVVVNAYEAIQAIDPFFQSPELKDELFTSYRHLIVDIAGRNDATLEDIETAEKYYRIALALFPQNKEYAKERDELQKIAAELLANKYYLHVIDLLKSTNYSVEGLQESKRILSKAGDIGSDSPAIQAEIEKAQLFLDSYDSLLNRRWDDAVSGFEELHRREEDYADGRAKYLLYEAYVARGDLLFDYADFGGALADFQEAEIFAWSDEENLLRLFQVEVRTAAALYRLERVEESAEFYNYAFKQLGYRNRFADPEEKDLLDTLNQADLAYKNGDDWDAVRLYSLAMEQDERFYDYKTVSVKQGVTLANIAFDYDCTIESLRVANLFGENMVIGKDQEILVPVVITGGQ